MITLRPSAAHRWSKCAAYPSFADKVPEQPATDAAKEGTCAAWVAECVLTGDAATCDDMVGKTHKNGWFVEQDMVNDIQKYCDIMTDRGPVSAEHKVQLVDGSATINGTLDAMTHVIKDKLLYVTDLKYGRRVVEVFENPQLIIYAQGLVNQLPPGSVEMIQLEIYQPRAWHHNGIQRKWVVSRDELLGYADTLMYAAARCYEPDPDATPGDHCTYCRAAPGCEALIHTTYAMIDTVCSPHHRDMTIDELSSELTFMDEVKSVIDARFKAVNDEAAARVKKGNIPGWRMVSKTGNRKFTVDASTLAMFTNIDPYDKKIITPAEAIRRGVSEATIDKLSEKPQIGHKLVRMTDQDIAAAFSRKEK